MTNFLYLLLVIFWSLFKSWHWNLILIFLISLFITFLYWFTGVIFNLKVDFVFVWRWFFLTLTVLAITWDFLVILIWRTISSFRLMKKFETTAKDIGIAILKYKLLSEKKIIDGNKDGFNNWFAAKKSEIKVTVCSW